MPKFSEKSRARLAGCDPRLQAVFNRVVKEYDCSILCGHRGESEQNALFAEKKTRVRWPNSKHNEFPSKAVDCVPYPVNWKDYRRMAHFAGIVIGVGLSMGVNIRWGGDWNSNGDLKDQTFLDYPHFEIRD